MHSAAEFPADVAALENKLNHFDPFHRKEALAGLMAMVERDHIHLPASGNDVNLHCHTFFSYNSYGYSPTAFAWLARRLGLAVAGIIDFDVLDGLKEFQEAGRRLRLKTCVGLETRVYIPEFADRVINSPGEPGISYHMGVGFPTSRVPDSQQAFLSRLRRTSEQRNRDLMRRVNEYLRPVTLDYGREVLPLTPSGNATERHICHAYALKARAVFPDDAELGRFWSEKLGVDASELDLPTSAALELQIRSKTMKQGGVGYVQPGEGAFPELAETNRFILAAGGIPTHTWLDGTSEGEARIEELLAVAMSTGVAAINVIPDRNYTPGSADVKLANLYQAVQVAEMLGLLVVAGTEMNSPGQKLVDDFQSEELSPLLPVFLKSAYAVYAHSVLQRESGLGYTSPWAEGNFPDLASRGEFFQEVGRRLEAGEEGLLSGLPEDARPEAVLERLT
jgi:hypothetical protein